MSPATDLVLRKGLMHSMASETAERDADVCRSWKYDSASLKAHLSSMQQVPVGDWGRYCYQYACSAHGEAELNGQVVRVEVNAGGWIALVGPDAVPTYWASPQRQPGFLASCDCCADQPDLHQPWGQASPAE